VNRDAIPAELRALDQWLLWREEDRDGKPTKVPYRCDGIGKASTTDPSTWSSYADAVAELELRLHDLAGPQRVDGIGFVFSPEDPYVGVDLDRMDADAGAIILALDSYTEHSVSGRGAHVIVRANLNGHTRRRQGPLEIYSEGRYFVVTGEHMGGTPEAIEDRQEQLEAVLARFLPNEVATSSAPTPVVPVDLDDQELLELMFAASNGADVRRLWEGDLSAHDDNHSRADLALLAHLAFWAGCDPGRMERMFSASALGQRDKWRSRADYRERTIETAIAGCSDVYAAPKSKVRPGWDAVGTHPASAPGEGVESAGASRVPYVVGTQGRDAPTPAPVSREDQSASLPPLEVEEAGAFAAVEEASAEPLLGDDENTVLAAGGSAVYFGDGGAGKTTLGLDRAFHYCAGREWLGLQVPRSLRVLWIEDEGPRGKFRKKVRAKFASWDGEPLEGRLHVLSEPWARFTFANGQMRAELVALVRDLEIDVVIAGPVARLGAEGGGTPKEIQAFVDLLELVRADLDRPLAYELIHHENKAGGISGAWEGATDTLVHVQARGNGHTAIKWDKARWASEIHGRTWKLDWRDGERFEIDTTPETTDEDIAETLLGLVRETPGRSWNGYDDKLTGKASRRRAVRDELLESGQLVNLGTPKAMKLYLPEQADGQTSLEAEL
jgi:putative DNA primase/helicase